MDRAQDWAGLTGLEPRLLMATTPLPRLRIRNAAALEGDTGTTSMTFEVRRKGGADALDRKTRVRFATEQATGDQAGIAGVDFQSVAGRLTFRRNQKVKTITVPIIPNETIEENKIFNVVLFNAKKAVVVRGEATGVIVDDDAPAQLSVEDVSVDEGDAGTTNMTFTVTLSRPESSDVTVDFATSDGTATAASDYAAATGTLTFAAGETSKTVNVEVSGDSDVEDDETLLLTLSNATGAVIATDGDEATGTITDDDAPPQLPTLSINDPFVAEGDAGTTDLVFNVSLSASSSQVVTVNFATEDVTATAGTDYVADTGTLTFNPGELLQTITISINGDIDVEPDETFNVNLTDPTNATIADLLGVGTITNDDAAL